MTLPSLKTGSWKRYGQRQLSQPISDKLPAAKRSACLVGTPARASLMPCTASTDTRPGHTPSQGEPGAPLLVHTTLLNWGTPKYGLGSQNLDMKWRGPWGITGMPAAACWGAPGAEWGLPAHVAMLIWPSLLPNIDFYKTGGNFSPSAEPGRLVQNQKLFMVDSIIVWDSLIRQNKLKKYL